MSGFGVGQGAGGTAVAVLRSIGESGKASPIRGGGRTEKRIRRREPGKIVAVWSSISQRAWAACVRCGKLSGDPSGLNAAEFTDFSWPLKDAISLIHGTRQRPWLTASLARRPTKVALGVKRKTYTQ